MNILVIKQTSLGDVLHASGPIRAIKKCYPGSRLILLTATTSADVYRHNPWVDELILIDRYEIKKNWYRKPLWAAREMWATMAKVRSFRFDLAFDLQGLAKTVIFLYGAHAGKKFVKGNWLGLAGFRNKTLHAIQEMNQLLAVAGIPANGSSMEFITSDEEKTAVDRLLEKFNPDGKPVLIISPFSRWPSKDWPLENYLEVCKAVSNNYRILFTGSADRKAEIDQGLTTIEDQRPANLAGKLTLLELAELCSRASLMVTGDSFPMHLAGAVQTPVIALFGPTDESKVGPLGERDQVIRVSGCDICDKKNCPRYCLARLGSAEVIESVLAIDTTVKSPQGST
jgi:ADP-heptose:LPS heptosyltransferase